MTQAAAKLPENKLNITGEITPAYAEILTPEALGFVTSLVEKFGSRREALLAERKELQKKIDGGWLPDFIPETKAVREGDWKVAPIPAPLQDRRVEITGPAEPKMIINALNSGAKVFMADTEDSLSPTWERIVEAQMALREAVRHTLTFTSPEGKAYRLNDKIATLVVRPRGWHLPEKHVLYQGKPISGSLFDFGLFFFHNAQYQSQKGTGPYFYIPKLESYEEARLWADVFAYSEEMLGIPHGTIRATVLIEVITAVFQMEEILHALKDYIAGLNCGRWDYIFSYIKKFSKRGDLVLPDRAQVVMKSHFLKAYSELLIKTCHKRGAFAMGGMAPQIPIKGNDEANEKALALVKADKEREAGWGHDGTWVAHPGLIPTAMEVFDRLMPTPNQVSRQRDDVNVTQKDLLEPHPGTITEGGLRLNANVSIQYTAAWLQGNGCVPINNLMEDAATAEISRAQLWQWAHHKSAKLEDGRAITVDSVCAVLEEELGKIIAQYGDADGAFAKAKNILADLVKKPDFVEFLTLPAYEALA